MDKFIIEGGIPLQGEITPAGNKNAALPLLAACLLTEEPVILHNLPDIRDVQAMRALLDEAGCRTVRCDVVPVSGLEKNPLSGKVERFIPLNEE